MLFDVKEVKETILDFSRGNAKTLQIYFTLL